MASRPLPRSRVCGFAVAVVIYCGSHAGTYAPKKPESLIGNAFHEPDFPAQNR